MKDDELRHLASTLHQLADSIIWHTEGHGGGGPPPPPPLNDVAQKLNEIGGDIESKLGAH